MLPKSGRSDRGGYDSREPASSSGRSTGGYGYSPAKKPASSSSAATREAGPLVMRPIPEGAVLDPYSSAPTFSAMSNVAGTLPGPERMPLPSTKDPMTAEQREDWFREWTSRQDFLEEQRRSGKAPSWTKKDRSIQSYGIVYGYDSAEDVEPKVMLSRKGLINRYTTEDGKRVAQTPAVEMESPMQWGLPGGASRPLEDYGLLKEAVPDAAEGGRKGLIRKLAAESGADELLAETGINVRSKAFSTTGTVYANDDRRKERTHAAFRYQGRVSDLVQQSNALLAAQGTADNEVSQVTAVPLSEAYALMQASFGQADGLVAGHEGLRSNSKAKDRFAGYGFDWHAAPLLALLEALKKQEKPKDFSGLDDHPDALKGIGLPGSTGPVSKPEEEKSSSPSSSSTVITGKPGDTSKDVD